MTSEDQLCLLLARGQLTPQVRTRILELLATPLQWARILERAHSHQVYPLLHRNLRDLGLPGVAEAVLPAALEKCEAGARRSSICPSPPCAHSGKASGISLFRAIP